MDGIGLGRWLHPAWQRIERLGSVEGALLLVAAFWGGSYAAVKVATQQMPPLEFMTWRFGLTFLVLLPALRALRHASCRQALPSALILGINLLTVFLCETFGITLTSAAHAAFLISLTVAFTPLCEWALLGQRPSPALGAAVALSVAGAGLLAFQRGTAAQTVAGDALIVAAALLRGVMVTLTRRFGLQHGLPALTLTAVQMGVLFVGSAVLMLLFEQHRMVSVPMTPTFWAAMVFLVLFCTVLAFLVQNHAARRTSASRLALLMGSEPLFGALAAVGMLGEPLSLSGWLGGLLIVGAAYGVVKAR